MSITCPFRLTNSTVFKVLILLETDILISRSMTFSGMDFILLQSKMTYVACLVALRKFFSTAFMFENVGAFISQ